MGKSFEDLLVYQKARLLRKRISEEVKTFPSDENYRLKDQMIRASRSITAQIAEGHGRFHFKENIQFCRVARASAIELQEHINVALDEAYWNQSKCFELKGDIEDVVKLLNGYINYLKKRLEEG